MLSYKENIPLILGAVETTGARKILDVGAGFGKFGLLIREQYLSSKAKTSELSPSDEIVIDAIEDTKYMLQSRGMKEVYNSVIEESMFTVLNEPFLQKHQYDLLLLIDVVEHHPKDKIIAMIETVAKYSGILISTPKHTVMYEQKYYGDDRHHMSQWEMSDFVMFHDIRIIDNPLSHIFIIPKQ